MTTADELRGLLERVEGGEAGRELDEAVCIAVGGQYGVTDDWAGQPLIGGLDDPVTTSLDAAIALVNRLLPGCLWTIGRSEHGIFATLLPPKPNSRDWDSFFVEPDNNSNPALALIAALLRAKIAEMESETT